MPSVFTILVVEDESQVRDNVLRMLSEKGFGVLTADSAHEGLQILKERPVDLLLTDIVMPGMDGVQLAMQAKLIRTGIKVLFCTGYAPKATERKAMRLGSVLCKPVRRTELIEAVELLLGSAA